MGLQETAKTILRRARREAVRVAARAGVPALYQRITGRRHLILLFHHIRAPGVPLDPFDTCPSHSVEVLRAVVEYLTNHFRVVGLRELVARRHERVPLAAITFDDGWRDTYDVAFPLLREFGVPATVFVTTGKIGSYQGFWQQVLGDMFRHAVVQGDAAAAQTLRKLIGAPQDSQFTAAHYRQTVIQWKGLPRHERARKIATLLAEHPDDSPGPRCFLSVAEIKEMHSAGIEFGSHTVHHELLDACPADRLDYELAESKAQIEAIVGDRVESIAYPNGNFSELVVSRSEALGYQMGCTVERRRIGVRENVLTLPRVEPEWDCPWGEACFDERGFVMRIR